MTAQSATPTLEAQSRTVAGKQVKQLRTQGILPAVLYGHDQKNLSLSLDAHSFEKLYNQVGSTTLLQLSVDGKAIGKVLVHDIQVHPVRRMITHADLYLVNLKEKLTTEVPLSFVGVADAVDILGGTFIATKDFVEIECLPDDLVQEIEVDITSLKTFDDALHVSDLVAPKGIVILDDADQVLASVSTPRSEDELADLDAAVETEVTTEFEKDGAAVDEEAAATEEK